MTHRWNQLATPLGSGRTGRRAVAALVSLVFVLTAACSGGDDGDETQSAGDSTTSSVVGPTEPGRESASSGTSEPDTTSSDGGSDTTEGEGGEGTETEPATPTTSPNLPPNDSPLADLLLAPSAFGEGFAPDDSVGDGTFDADMCEDVTLDATFDDQAGQGLLAGTDRATVAVNQTVMRFADEAKAEAFAAAVAAGIEECQPGIKSTDVDAGVGAKLYEAAGDAFAVAGAVVRVGALVSYLTAFGGDADLLPITSEIVSQVAERLTA